MTLPQARFLLRELDAVDGHRETARLVIEGIIDIAVAGGLVKRAEPKAIASRQPDTNEASVTVADTIIPELQSAIEATLVAKGWQPPASPVSKSPITE